MTREVVSPQLLEGGSGLTDQLPRIIREQAGYTVSPVAGAAAATQMNIPAIRLEDTILAAIQGDGTDDTDNVSIVDTHASGTMTMSGDPADGDTFTVGRYTYTWRTAPTLPNEVKITAGDDDANAAAAAFVVNAYESRYDGSKATTPTVQAVAASAVVTFKSVVDGAGNGPVVSNSAHCTIVGSGSASVTGTCAAMVNGDTVTVNGVVFTVRTTPDLTNHQDVGIGADNNAQAVLLANAINLYEQAHGTLGVTASATGASAVVTIVPSGDLAGNIIPLAMVGAGMTVSGATLAGGSNTGGVTSTTDLTGKKLVVHWLNKR